jgi:hypothetical protein
MAQTINPQKSATDTAPYTVTRAIFMNGQRVEVGDTVEMTALQYAEAYNAGKVGPLVAKPAASASPVAPAKKAAKVADTDEPAP